VLFGVAITVYVFSVVAAFLVEVEGHEPFLEAQNAETLSELSDSLHRLRFGRTGRSAVGELQKTGRPMSWGPLRRKSQKSRDLHSEDLKEILYVP